MGQSSILGGFTLNHLWIVVCLAGCAPATGMWETPAPLPPDGRPIDATTSRVMSARGDRVSTHNDQPWLDRSQAPVKLNRPLPPGGRVVLIRARPGEVVYLADQDTLGLQELYYSRFP